MASSFDFDNQATPPSRPSRGRGRKNRNQSPGWLVPAMLLAVAVFVGGVGFAAWKILLSKHLELGAVAGQHAKELAELRVKIPVVGLKREEVRLALASGAPKGARMDAATGEFRWTPGEEAGGKRFPITVVGVAKDDSSGRPNRNLSS